VTKQQPIKAQTHLAKRYYTAGDPGKRIISNSFLFHFRPRTVPDRTLQFHLTWGLGGMAAVLVLVQLCTGLLLKFVYEPNPALAHASIVMLQNEMQFGKFIRSIHHWSANFLILVAFLHFLRVFFTGAFHPPRRLNWLIGLGLFVLILLANLSGYLLPWDQLAFWAVTICTAALAYIPWIGGWLQASLGDGAEIDANTLHIFYSLHTALVPLLIVVCMAFHFWRVRKAGGLVIPKSPGEQLSAKQDRVATIPNLLLREAVVAALLLAFVFSLSALFAAPLGEPANPGLSPNPTKAPWYFAGIQEMLMHVHPTFAVVVVPLLFGSFLIILPFIRFPHNTAGIWFGSYIGRRTSLLAAAAALILTIISIVLEDKFFAATKWFPSTPVIISGGLIPVALILCFFGTACLLLKKIVAATLNEIVQALFVYAMVSYIVFTIVMVWFRGQGMVLGWP